MISLAIETSGRLGSVALMQDEQILDEQSFEHGFRHAADIIPVIDRMAGAHDIAANQILRIFVSAGPGSFTGIRIGITLAKTLAFATGAKIVAVPTVAVLAENAPAEARNLIIVLDAKRGQIFTARFSRSARGDARWIEIEPAHLDTLAAMLSRSPRATHLLGEGIAYHRPEIPDDPGVIITDESTWQPRAAVVGRIGLEMATQNEFTPMDQLTPIYLRRPEAEEKWEARQTRVLHDGTLPET